MFTQEQALGRGAASLTSDMYAMAMQYATYYPPRQEYIQSEISYGSRPTRHTKSTIHTQPTRKQLPQQLQQQIRQRSKQQSEQIMYNNANPNDSNENPLNLSKCGLNHHAKEFVPFSALKEKKCEDKHAPVRASAAATGRDEPARGAPAHSVPAAVSAASVNVMFNRYNNNDNDNNDNNDKKNVFVGAPERLLVAPMDTRSDPAYGSDFAIITPITDPGTEVSLFGTISTADTADTAADANTGNNVNTVNTVNTVSDQCGSGSVGGSGSVSGSGVGVSKNDSDINRNIQNDNNGNKSFKRCAISGKNNKVSKIQKKEKLSSKVSKFKEELEKQSMYMRYEPCDEVDPCGKEHSCFRFDQQTIEDGMAGKRVHRPQRLQQRQQQPQFGTLSQTARQTGRQTESKTQTQTTEMFERVTLCDWICEDSDKYRGIFNLGLRAQQVETYQARGRYLLSKIAHMLYCFHKSDEMCYFDGVSKKNISLALQWEKKKKVEMKDEGDSVDSDSDSDEYDIFIVPMFDKPPMFARRYKEDVLYLGVLMYDVLTYSPFHDECGPRPDMDPQKIEDRLQWLRRDHKVPKLALDLAEHMLCDENVRYTMTEVMEHEYIKSAPDTFPSVNEDVIEFPDPPEELPEWPQFPEPPEVAPLSSIYKV